MNKRVLIIDDDMDLCLLLGKLLTKNGYETEASYTGNKGITRFSEKKFDAVICDYRLGDMEGKHVLTELKKADPSVIVLIITGFFHSYNFSWVPGNNNAKRLGSQINFFRAELHSIINIFFT